MEEYHEYVADVDSILNRLEPQDYDTGELIETSQQNHGQRLEEELDRIKEQLEQRDEVHDEITDDLEWKLDRYKDRLEKMHTHARGKADGERERVKDRINELSALLREERRKHWQDKQTLQRERRELLRTLDEATDQDWLDAIK